MEEESFRLAKFKSIKNLIKRKTESINKQQKGLRLKIEPCLGKKKSKNLKSFTSIELFPLISATLFAFPWSSLLFSELFLSVLFLPTTFGTFSFSAQEKPQSFARVFHAAFKRISMEFSLFLFIYVLVFFCGGDLMPQSITNNEDI